MSKADQIERGDINFEEFSETELWNEIKSGNQTAFSFLYKKFVKNLFKYGFFLVSNKDIVEDAIHDIFIRIWLKRDNHIHIHSIKSYLYTSLRREVLLKKQQNVKIAEQLANAESNFMNQPSVEDSWINQESQNELISKVRSFIDNLTDRQREIIYLRFYQNLSYQEIAELLHIDQNYAYNLTSKAFAHIKKQFHPNKLLKQ